jgi:hypothetical protein
MIIILNFNKKEVGQLDWLNMSKVLFHIADAPAHGKYKF